MRNIVYYFTLFYSLKVYCNINIIELYYITLDQHSSINVGDIIPLTFTIFQHMCSSYPPRFSSLFPRDNFFHSLVDFPLPRERKLSLFVLGSRLGRKWCVSVASKTRQFRMIPRVTSHGARNSSANKPR